ncbi:MAG TPA: S8 family peptidase, partial [Acidimicrobiales bacterium]
MVNGGNTERDRGISWAVPVLVALLVAATLAPVATALAMRSGTGPRAVVDPQLAGETGRADVLVQALPGRLAEAQTAVTTAGGVVGRQLPIIDGFEADLPLPIPPSVTESGAIRSLSANRPIQFEEYAYEEGVTGSNFAKTSGAASAWTGGALGEGVGVAVIDTGIADMTDLKGRVVQGPDLSGEGSTVDSYGHGTVMAGIIAGSGADSATTGKYTGVAPKSHLVAIKAAGRNGVTDVSTMLAAMHWVAAYKDQFNIRVLNLSWGTPSTQDPAVDPLNYAVQRLWKLGIVVVVAAGNSGPNAGTIMKPGDDPMAITVGAFDDKQNTDPLDDSISSWSSRGPTASGLSKPDVVAPGRSLVASRSFGSAVEKDNPKALVAPSYIRGSGTSQAAAVTSGLIALMLSKRPDLTPDQVKALLKGTAAPLLAQPTSVQGVGRVRLDVALNAPVPLLGTTQTSRATGLGSLEASRGGRNVQTDCGNDGTIDVIKGEIDTRCEAWNGTSWTGTSWTGTSWTGTS